jgi:hypothetical protein
MEVVTGQYLIAFAIIAIKVIHIHQRQASLHVNNVQMDHMLQELVYQAVNPTAQQEIT